MQDKNQTTFYDGLFAFLLITGALTVSMVLGGTAAIVSLWLGLPSSFFEPVAFGLAVPLAAFCIYILWKE